jgi:hypothetical protein
LVSGLGWALYEALDYGCKQNEQNILSPDLEQMIDFLTSAGKSGSFFLLLLLLSCSTLNPPPQVERVDNSFVIIK